VVQSSEPEINLDISTPVPNVNASYSVTENVANNYLTYFVKNTYAGNYTIYSKLFKTQQSYYFQVEPGVPSSKASLATLNARQLSAGDVASASAIPYDQYGNLIPISRQNITQYFSVILNVG